MVGCKVGEEPKAEAVCLLLMGVLKLWLVLATPKLTSFSKNVRKASMYIQ